MFFASAGDSREEILSEIQFLLGSVLMLKGTCTRVSLSGLLTPF